MSRLALPLIVVGLMAGCGGSDVSPSPAPSSAAGDWSGTGTDATGHVDMKWTVVQTGTALSGTMTVSDTGRGMMGTGTMRGSADGRAVAFHMDVPTGGFGGMMSSCAMAMDGSGTMSDDGHTMAGTYSGSMMGMMSGAMMGQACGGDMKDGRFTMTR